jgi:hypothetical protein
MIHLNCGHCVILALIVCCNYQIIKCQYERNLSIAKERDYNQSLNLNSTNESTTNNLILNDNDCFGGCCLINCRNNGECLTNSIGNPYCVCRNGFIGLYCELNIGSCSSMPCQNDGICRFDAKSELGYKCLCKESFSGENCESADPCSVNDCRNGAVCIPKGTDYKCVCNTGFTGIYCQNVLKACTSSPCSKNSICQDRENGGFSCLCMRK